MFQGHFVILSTFIKLPFVIKIFVLSIFEWLFYAGIIVHVFEAKTINKVFFLKKNLHYYHLLISFSNSLDPDQDRQNFFNPTLNIKMVFGEKIPKMGTFSDFVTIFFVKCYNKI